MDKIQFPDFSSFSFSLKNKVILITGATRGIGRALAFEAAKQGANVIILGKDLKKLEKLYDDIMEKGYPEPAIYPINLLRMEPQHGEELAQNIQRMFGRLDAIVHNAAISGPITPLEHLPPGKWQEVLHLNLHIPYLLTYCLLPLLKKTPYASVIFTAANEAYKGKAYWGAYSASKFGIIGLAQSLHQEVEDNTTIRVNCINPGVVRTAIRINAYPGIDPLTFPAPEEIVPHYLYLLSDHAKAIRGKCVECLIKQAETVA